MNDIDYRVALANLKLYANHLVKGTYEAHSINYSDILVGNNKFILVELNRKDDKRYTVFFGNKQSIENGENSIVLHTQYHSSDIKEAMIMTLELNNYDINVEDLLNNDKVNNFFCVLKEIKYNS